MVRMDREMPAYRLFNSDNARICSGHFKNSSYERNLKYELLGKPVPKNCRKLKLNAVPTLNLPACEGTIMVQKSESTEEMEKEIELYW
ncbi:hypothetical protein ABEB36_004803 [Hypothenemus hampei]|uniref:THAP-type domain-containing protein n=1 Tax=Hypothenemus hampei TaxID=57062 RepID=A0ABD1EVV7_HYPHA